MAANEKSGSPGKVRSGVGKKKNSAGGVRTVREGKKSQREKGKREPVYRQGKEEAFLRKPANNFSNWRRERGE